MRCVFRRSEAGASMGVPGHKQVASFSSTGSQDGSFDFGSSNFRGINEADFLLPDGMFVASQLPGATTFTTCSLLSAFCCTAARSRSMTESSSQSVSPTPMSALLCLCSSTCAHADNDYVFVDSRQPVCVVPVAHRRMVSSDFSDSAQQKVCCSVPTNACLLHAE